MFSFSSSICWNMAELIVLLCLLGPLLQCRLLHSWIVFNISFQNDIIKGRISTKMAVVSKFTCNNKADLVRILEDIDGCISSNDSESEELDGARVHGQLSKEKTSAKTKTFSWQHVDCIHFSLKIPFTGRSGSQASVNCFKSGLCLLFRYCGSVCVESK